MVRPMFLILYGFIGLISLLILTGLFKTILGIRIMIKKKDINNQSPDNKEYYKIIARSGYLLFLAVFLQIPLFFLYGLNRTEIVDKPLAIWETFIFINFYALTLIYLFNYSAHIISYFKIRKNNLSNPLNLISIIIRGLPLILLIIFILDRTIVNIL